MKNACNLLKLKLYEKQKLSIPKVEKVWCQKQIDDFERVMSLMEEVICAAISSGKSAQHYVMFEEAKSNFVEEFIKLNENYRVVEGVT